MIYFSIDIETTGVDPKEHTILEFGAILEDTEKKLSFEEIPKFNCLLKHPKYVGTPYALAMHKEIFEELNSGKSSCPIIPYNDLGMVFKEWLVEQNKKYLKPTPDGFINITKDRMINVGFMDRLVISVAGKNFGTFDMRFLENLEDFKRKVWFEKRIIDPAILYFDNKTDLILPDLSTCKERAGIKDTAIAHRTIQDAWDVIQVLRNKMY